MFCGAGTSWQARHLCGGRQESVRMVQLVNLCNPVYTWISSTHSFLRGLVQPPVPYARVGIAGPNLGSGVMASRINAAPLGDNVSEAQVWKRRRAFIC